MAFILSPIDNARYLHKKHAVAKTYHIFNDAEKPKTYFAFSELFLARFCYCKTRKEAKDSMMRLQESVWLWEIPPSMSVYHIQQPHMQITSITFNINNILLVSGSCDGPTQAWRLENYRTSS